MWTKQVIDKIMASKLDFEYVKGEWNEFVDEVRNKNYAAAYDEWEDTTGCFLVWLTGKTGISLPILPGFGLGAVVRWHERLITWEIIFGKHGVDFDKKYLVNGGNYRKRHKVEKALRLAGYEGEIEWGWICDNINLEE